MSDQTKTKRPLSRAAQFAIDDQPTEQAVADHIASRLLQRRRQLGLSLQQVAATIGVSFQQIQKYEAGGAAVSSTRLWALAAALGVSPAYFYEGLQATAFDDG